LLSLVQPAFAVTMSACTEPGKLAREASCKNTEVMAKQSEEMLMKKKKRDKHHEDMVKASLMSPPLNVKPLHLQSEVRHKANQQKMVEQQAMGEEAGKEVLDALLGRATMHHFPSVISSL
jgi:hypothetical protein